MPIYAGLDVSDKTTHVCVVDAEGAVLRREVLASDPDVIAKWLRRYCLGARCSGDGATVRISLSRHGSSRCSGRVYLRPTCQGRALCPS